MCNRLKEIREMHEDSGMENIDSRHMYQLFWMIENRDKRIKELEADLLTGDKLLRKAEAKLYSLVANYNKLDIELENENFELKAQLDAVRSSVQANDDWEVSAKEALKAIKKALGEDDND